MTGAQDVSSALTRAGGGTGRPQHKIPGAAPEYVAPQPGPIAKHTTRDAAKGFDAATSQRDPAASTATENVFKNADGSVTKHVYPQPVNFRGTDGVWRPIDNRLNGSDGRLKPTGHRLKLSFAGAPNDKLRAMDNPANLVSLTFPTGQSFGYSLSGAATVEPQVAGETAIYRDILPSTDLELTTLDNGVKETIVIRSADAATEWLFPLTVSGGLSLKVEKSGSISLRNAKGGLLGSIPNGWMEDSKTATPSGDGAISDKVRYELVKLPGGAQALKVTADRNWIRDPARVFPIKVDPTVNQETGASTYVQHPYTANRRNETVLKTGYTDYGGPYTARSFIKFDSFPGPYSGKHITSASVNFNIVWSGTCDTWRASTIDVYDLANWWSATDVTNWDNMPGLAEHIGSAYSGINPAKACHSDPTQVGHWWNIGMNDAGLRMLNRWTTHGQNNGLSLVAGGNSDSWKQISSVHTNHKPYLNLTYVDNVEPRIEKQEPPFGYAAPTLTPELSADGVDPDNWPANGVKYAFFVLENGNPVTQSPEYSSSRTFTVPAGKLQWGKSYQWYAAIYDGFLTKTSPVHVLNTVVPQPLITSGLAQNPSDRGFEPRVGNFTTKATDAQVVSAGPDLSIERSYNSRDPRTGHAFGAGWSSILDSRVTRVGETLVVTYPSGQEVAFGRKADGTYIAPSGSVTTTMVESGGGTVFTLTDGTQTKYVFSTPKNGASYLTSITDAFGRKLDVGQNELVSSTSGRKLRLTWSNGRVATVANDMGETWKYTYTGTNLTKVCTPASDTKCIVYEYTNNSLYSTAMLDAAPRSYLRLTEAAGAPAAVTSAVDSMQIGTGRYVNVVTPQSAGLPGSTATAPVFNGGSSRVELGRSLAHFSAYQTVSLRFKTTNPGVLYSLQNGPAENTNAWTPVVYVGHDGKVHAKFWNDLDSSSQMVSTQTVTDGGWHHVVIVADGKVQRLYLDGAEAGTAQNGAVQLNWANYAIIGAGRWLNWPSTGGDYSYFSGQISDFAHYQRALTASQVSTMFAASAAAAPRLSKIVRQGGGIQSKVDYDPLTGVVTKVTDQNNGVWQIGTPVRSGAGQAYASKVLASGPVDYFRLHDQSNEVNGGTAAFTGVTLGNGGGLLGSNRSASSFDGDDYIRLPDHDYPNAPTANSVSLWFRTKDPGVLYSAQKTAMGTAHSQYEPALYVGTDGKLHGGYWGATPIASGPNVNDGQWHHATLTSTGTQQTLYLDGVKAGTQDASPETFPTVYAYLGAGQWNGWPATTGDNGYFKGFLAEFAYFRHALSDAEVAAQYFGRDLSQTVKALPQQNIVTTGPNTVSMWFQMPKDTGLGGVLYSYQSHPISDPDNTVSWVPALYVGTDGLLRGKFWNGGNLTGPKVNDGNWHHVVLTAGGGGQWMFLDGAEAAQTTGTLSSTGSRYAYLGGGKWEGWPGASGKVGVWPGSINGFTFDNTQWNQTQVTAARAAGLPAGAPEVTAPSSSPVNTVTVTDPMGGVISNLYDVAAGGRQIEIVNARGKSARFGFDTNGFQRSVIDGNKNVSIAEHDERGNIIAQTTCQNRAQNKCSTTYYSFHWDAANPADLRNNKMTAMRDARSTSATDDRFRTQYVLNTFGDVIETIDPLGRSAKTDFTDGKSILTDLNVTGTGRYVRMNGTLRGFAAGFSLWELQVYGTGNDNLALNKPTTVSSTESTSLPGAHAVDGEPTTRWSSAYTDTEKIVVDLGQSYAINRVKLLWETAYGKHYTIDVSADGTNWTTLKTFDAVNPQSAAPIPAGIPYRTTSPVGAKQTITHNAAGDEVESVDATGVRTRTQYDLIGRTIISTVYSNSFPAGLSTTTLYDKLGRVTSVAEPAILNHVTSASHTRITTTDYNADGQTLWVKVADNSGGDAPRTVTTEYNILGQRTSQSDAHGNKTLFAYDLHGRLVKQTAPDGMVTEAGYDPSGNQVSTKVNGVVMETRAFDDGGRLATTTDAMGWESLFSYSDNNLPVKSVRRDPATGKTFMTEYKKYDPAGNLTAKLSDNGVTLTEYTVDAAGRTVSQTTDPTGVNRTVVNAYGDSDEILSTTSSGSTGSHKVEMTYDIAGRMLTRSVSVPGGTGGPAGWWRLNEGAGTIAADAAQGAQHGTAANGVTWSDGAAQFDGSDDQISTAGPVLDTTNSYSVSFWAKPETAAFRMPVAADGAHKSAFLVTYSTAGRWEMHHYTNDTSGSSEDTWAISGQSYPTGQWAHVVGVYDKSAGKLRVYVNGTKAEGAAFANPFAATGKLTIGRSKFNDQQTGFFSGAVANVQAYQKVLTDAEVSTLASAGRGGAALSPAKSTTTWKRNQLGLPWSEKDPLGNETLFVYDEANRVVQTISPQVTTVDNAGNSVTAPVVARNGYDTFGGQTHIQDGRGMVTTTDFNANGRPANVLLPDYIRPGETTPLKSSRQTVYDNMSRVVKEVDPLGRAASYAYDQFGRLLTATGPDGGVTTRTYHLSGQPASVTAPDGARAEATWDFLGRQATSTQLVRRSGQATLALTTTSVYATGTGCKDDGTPSPVGCAGWPIGATSPEPGRVSSTPTYNSAGETTQIKDPFNNITKYAYDFAGRQTAVIAPDGAKQTVTFDVAGRPTTQRMFSPTGTLLSTQTAGYDLAGQVISSTDARGSTSTSTYDATGWVTSVTQPISSTDSITTQYAYNPTGAPTRVTNGRGKVFRTTYNTWGMPESTIEPGGNTYTVSYDLAGRADRMSLPGGVGQTTTYDSMDRPIKSVGAGAEAATADRTMTYDSVGRVKTLSGPGGDNTLSYDDRGLLTSIAGPSGNSSFAYTNDGLMSSRTDAAGTTTYAYDAGGRLDTAANTGAGLAFKLAYNVMSQPSTITYGSNENRRAYSYDDFGRLAADELKTSAGASIGKISYGYDLNGNLTSKVTNGFAGAAANAYTYDQSDRLRTWTTGSSTVDYDYDKAGNRVKVGSRTFSYNDANRLQSSSDGTAYNYTARGTLSSTTTGTVTLPTIADAFGQILKQHHTTTAFSEYAYDGLGRVVNPGFAYTGTGNDLAADPAAQYIRGPGGGLIGSKAGSSSYAWTDLHSDVVAQFTSAATTLSGSQTFDPWGKPLATAGFVGNLGYQSAWTDQNTKRVNMAARWYNPDTGQFDSRDTTNVPNRHAYTDANPLTQVDPTGHQRERIEGGGSTQPTFEECDGARRNSSKCDWRPPRSPNPAKPAPKSPQSCYSQNGTALCPGFGAGKGPDQRPNANTDPKCRLGASGSADCSEAARRNGETSRCPHLESNYSRMLPVSCTQVNTASGCSINGQTIPGLSGNACLDFAWEIDDYGHDYRNPDDPVVQQAVLETHIQEAYQHAVGKQQERDAQVAAAKCNADFWCRNADMVGTVVGAVAGVIAGAVCLVATAGAGSIGCMMLAGFVGGFVGSLATSVAKSGWDSLGQGDTWLNATIAGGIGALTGAAGGVAGAVIGRAVGSVIGRAVTSAISNSVRSAGSRVASTAVGRAVSATSNAVGNAARSTVTAVERKVGSTAVGIACEIGVEVASAAATGHSFDPKTKVVMADGSTKDIEDIAIGDEVKATDPSTGETTSEPVTKLHVNADEQLADVTVQDDATGKTSVLKTTANHPFWSATDREWTDAADLTPGERLRDDQGKETQQVVAVKTWTGLQRMHDLTVDNVHTYYVVANDKPTLVHNCGNKAAADGMACACGAHEEVWDGAEQVFFGQARVGADFSSGGRFHGAPIFNIASQLRSGKLSPDVLQVDAFRFNGLLVTENNRSLTTLSLAGLKPTNVRIFVPTGDFRNELAARMAEPGLLGDLAPQMRMVVTPDRHDLRQMLLVHLVMD